MTDFEFTKDYTVNSSVIDEVYFNENDSTAVLDVNDYMYRYSGVTAADIAELIDAPSVGAYYNKQFKAKFGPAEQLGHWVDVDFDRVPVVKDDSGVTTPKGLSYGEPATINADSFVGSYAHSAPAPHLTVAADNSGATKEYSFGVFDHSVSGSPVAVSDEPTKEFSLQSVPDAGIPLTTVGDDSVSIRVHFTLDGSDQKFKYDADAIDVDEAIEELHDYVSRVGARGKVTKVVVKFD